MADLYLIPRNIDPRKYWCTIKIYTVRRLVWRNHSPPPDSIAKYQWLSFIMWRKYSSPEYICPSIPKCLNKSFSLLQILPQCSLSSNSAKNILITNSVHSINLKRASVAVDISSIFLSAFSRIQRDVQYKFLQQHFPIFQTYWWGV